MHHKTLFDSALLNVEEKVFFQRMSVIHEEKEEHLNDIVVYDDKIKSHEKQEKSLNFLRGEHSRSLKFCIIIAIASFLVTLMLVVVFLFDKDYV